MGCAASKKSLVSPVKVVSLSSPSLPQGQFLSAPGTPISSQPKEDALYIITDSKL